MSRNPHAVDAQAESVVRGSVVHRVADGALRRGRAAWQSSMIHRFAPAGPGGRIRFWGTATITAALTALVMLPFGTTPRPLAWLTPAVAGVVALLLLVFSPRPSGTDGSNR